MRKNKLKDYKILIFITLLIFQISFISSQDVLDIIDIGLEIGFLEGEIKGIGIKTQKLNDDITSFTFLIENAFLMIKDNSYTNIIPHGTDNKKAYINVDKSAEIIQAIQADFTVDENGGSYTLGDKTYEVPNGTRISLKDGKVDIDIPDGTDLSKFSSLLEYISGSYLTTIKGKDIKIFDGFDLIDGELNVESGGFFLKEGVADYKKVRLTSTEEDGGVLIANLDADLNKYDKNVVKIGDDVMEIKSITGGRINLEVLPGNELLNTFQLKLGEDGITWETVPDEKDNLKFEVSNGDVLKVISRENDGKTPFIVHDGAEEGLTNIENGRINLNLGKTFDLDTKTFDDQETFERIISGKYQSVPFELSSPLIFGEKAKLRIGGANNFAIMDKDNEERVVLNRYKIPVSDSLQKNQLQTLDQLKVKWEKRGVGFQITEEKIASLFGDIDLRSPDYTEISPYMVQIVDYWLETHPNANLDYITFSDMGNAQSGDPTQGRRLRGILLGEQIFDPYTNEILQIAGIDRNFDDPISIITHEYEHVDDQDILKKDIDKIHDSTRNLFYNDELRIKAEEYASSVVKKDELDITKSDIYSSIFKSSDSFIGEVKSRYEVPRDYLEKYGPRKFRRAFKLTRNENPEDYVNRERELYEALITDRDVRDTLENEGFEKTMERYKDFIEERVFLVKKIRTENVYLSNHFLNNDETKPLIVFYNDIVLEAREKLLRNQDYIDLLDNIFVTLENEKEGYSENLMERAKRFILQQGSEDKYAPEGLSIISNFGAESEVIKQQYQELIKIIDEETGLPAVYAFRDYGSKFIDFLGNIKIPSTYSELSSTYREEPLGVRRFKAQQGTAAQQSVYKMLTQLAFDSGKMDAFEYMSIMGNICVEISCCDQKCKIYKSNCVGSC